MLMTDTGWPARESVWQKAAVPNKQANAKAVTDDKNLFRAILIKIIIYCAELGMSGG
jgi:hypothetical protein